MESANAAEPDFLVSIFYPLLLPYFAFFSGVWIAHKIGLYTNVKRVVWYLSIPTGLVIPSLLISSASISVNKVTYYGYMESIPDYLFFCG